MEILHLWLIFGRFQNAIAQLKLKWRPNPKSNIISVMTSLGAPKISNREEKNLHCSGLIFRHYAIFILPADHF